MNALVVPAFAIDRIGTKDLQLPRVNLRRQYPDHASVFILEKPALGSGEDQQGSARVSEDQQFHIAMQFGAVPFVVFAVHGGRDRPIGWREVSYLIVPGRATLMPG